MLGPRNVKANPGLAVTVSPPVQNPCETHTDDTYHKLA
jgi:hypothetical protein